MYIGILSLLHLLCITASNILVQYPFECLGYQTTWGAFTYPLIFILSDLTVRLKSAKLAKKIVLNSLIPSFIISYLITASMEDSIFSLHLQTLRVAIACLLAYCIGQFFDINIFQHLKRQQRWWLAPLLSNTLSNIIDTFVFFACAFYRCENPILCQHWPEIACFDLLIKMAISSVAFIPFYGLCLTLLTTRSLKISSKPKHSH